MRVFFRRIHMYLGIAAGLVITITCLTGSILVFQEELEHAAHHEYYYVQPGTSRQPVSQLVANLIETVPGCKPNSIRVCNTPERSVEVTYGLKEKTDAAPGKKDKKPKNNFKAFINPYSGAIIQTLDTRTTFFSKVLALHRWLLSEDTGKVIVGISTLIFCFILITGIILWWPANKNMLKQRLRLGSGGAKRLNYQWHTVLGFYTAFFLFTFAFTGLAWAFKWFNNGIYAVTNSPLKNPVPLRSVIPHAKQTNFMYDTALESAQNQYSQAVFYNIQLPKEIDDPITVQVLNNKAVHEAATEALYFDAYNGQQTGHLFWNERSRGARVRATFRPVHTSSIWGIPSKIIGFIACLLGATFPFTGYVILINRLRKKKVVTLK